MLRKLSASETHAYLARIGVEEPLNSDAEALARLHLAHLKTVPFENLDIHLGRKLDLAPDALFDKIVRRKRGGFCYELNGLFARLLHTLGYRLTLLSARVGREDGSFGREFDHMTLRVDLARPWLADVGFGDAFTAPLHLKADEEQHEPGKRFILTRDGEAWDYRERVGDGAWKTEYRFHMIPRRPHEFEEMCIWQQTSPQSHFTRNVICTRVTERDRITIGGKRFIETKDGQRSERTIESEEELRTLLRERFGIAGIDRDLLPQAAA